MPHGDDASGFHNQPHCMEWPAQRRHRCQLSPAPRKMPAVGSLPDSWMSTRRTPAGGLGKPCMAASNIAASTVLLSPQGPSLAARVSYTTLLVAEVAHDHAHLAWNQTGRRGYTDRRSRGRRRGRRNPSPAPAPSPSRPRGRPRATAPAHARGDLHAERGAASSRRRPALNSAGSASDSSCCMGRLRLLRGQALEPVGGLRRARWAGRRRTGRVLSSGSWWRSRPAGRRRAVPAREGASNASNLHGGLPVRIRA
jgi:hypothetical protein